MQPRRCSSWLPGVAFALVACAAVEAPADEAEVRAAETGGGVSDAETDEGGLPACSVDLAGSEWVTGHLPGVWGTPSLSADTVFTPLVDGGLATLDDGVVSIAVLWIGLREAPNSDREMRPLLDVRTTVRSPGGRELYKGRYGATFGTGERLWFGITIPYGPQVRGIAQPTGAEVRDGTDEVFDTCRDRAVVEIEVVTDGDDASCTWKQTWKDVRIEMDAFTLERGPCWQFWLDDEAEPIGEPPGR